MACLKEVNFFTRCRGIFFGIVLLLGSLFGCYIIMLFLPFLIFNRHRLWRILVDRGVGFWLLLPVSLMDFLFGTKFTVTGDPISPNEPSLIIMNHRTRLDWMHFWSALYKINPWLLTTEKIALKAQLQKLPGAGWAMAANAFIFLERNREADSERLSEAIDYYSDLNTNYQLLFFPEGTDKSPGTTERSKEYARKNDLKPYEYLIHPRTTGFIYLLNKMRRRNYIKCVYDVTIAFPDRIVQSELELGLTGVAPQSVHFDIHRIDITDVPKSEDEVGTWLNKLWRQKEEKLRTFYEKPVGKRCFTPSGCGLVWPIMKQRSGLQSEAQTCRVICNGSATPIEIAHVGVQVVPVVKDTGLHFAVKTFAMALWLSVLCMWSLHTFILPFIQYCLISAVITYFVIRKVYGGIDLCMFYRSKLFKQRIGQRKLRDCW